MSLRSHRNNLHVPNECRFFEVWLCASRVPLTTGFPVKTSGSTIKKSEILLKVLISQSFGRPRREHHPLWQSRSGPNSPLSSYFLSIFSFLAFLRKRESIGLIKKFSRRIRNRLLSEQRKDGSCDQRQVR